MGRPPIGERAMTAAEKMRRYRERKPKQPPKPSAQAEPDAALRARIAELERELAEVRQAKSQDGIDIPSLLSASQRERYEAARRRLEKEFEQFKEAYKRQAYDDAAAHMDQWLEETLLPKLRSEQDEAKDIIQSRKGIMDKATFNKIRRCLHTDSRKSASAKVLDEAFTSFMALEKRLLKQADSPTEIAPIPKNRAEWEALRRKAKAQKQRASNPNPANASATRR